MNLPYYETMTMRSYGLIAGWQMEYVPWWVVGIGMALVIWFAFGKDK